MNAWTARVYGTSTYHPFNMKRRMIPAGALFLVMACGNSAKKDESPQTFRTQEVELVTEQQPEPPAPTSPEESISNQNVYAEVTYDRSGNSDGGVISELSNGWKGREHEGPQVGAAISSSAAREGTDTTRRFLRTADLRFRVKDVVKATIGIEDIVGTHKGWVTKTELRSEPRGTTLVPVSEDSVLEIARYELINTITLRVPNTELDSSLRQIGRWVDLFEHRNILADDIRLRMMANAMAIRRAKAHSLRVSAAIDDQGRKLKETLAAEEALQASDERRDQGILNNMDLADRVAYSTVTVDIYQRTLIRRELIANERNIEGYRPSLWSRLSDALKNGWRLVELTLTGLVSIWPVVLLLGVSLGWLWRGRRKQKAAHPTPPAVQAPQGPAHN
jgi:Domain of unknown function (DUF4349)